MSNELNVIQCHACWAWHFLDDGPCPNCEAGAYYQCWGNNDEHYADALETTAWAHREEAARLERKARELLEEAVEWRKTHAKV